MPGMGKQRLVSARAISRAIAKLGRESSPTFVMTPITVIVGHVCYVSAALPATPEEAQALMNMAEFAASRAEQNRRLRGAMNFRAGHYEAAIADFNRAMTVFPRRAWDWLFLAMSHQKLGQADEARKALAKAVEWIEQTNRRPSGGTTTHMDRLVRTTRSRANPQGSQAAHSVSWPLWRIRWFTAEKQARGRRRGPSRKRISNKFCGR